MIAPRILVATGTRADFGLLLPVMRALSAGGAELRVLATAAHLLSDRGDTLRELAEAGFAADRVVDCLVAGDSRAAMGKSIGLGLIGYVDAIRDLAPDCVLLLGDRFEMLGVATAALALDVPLAHLEGGHVTEGAVDDSIRHAITKMARLHFTAAEPYARRLRQMGEDPARVHVVGATGLDIVLHAPRLARADLEADLDLALGSPLLVVTHHPATADSRIDPADEMAEVLAGLDRVADATIVLTGANVDPGGDALNRMAAAFVAAAPERRRAVANLGYRRYASLLALADCVVGNSSSGVIEAPSLGVPTVNVGRRQQGRLRAPSVIDVAPERAAVAAGLNRALSPDHRALAARCENPMGDGHAGERVAEILLATDFAALGPKRFFDLETRDRTA